MEKRLKKRLFWFIGGFVLLIASVISFELIITMGRTQIQVNIRQNKEQIHLSTFAEPPQFAIWLEDPETHKCVTVFVTHRVAVGDWEGKSNVPVALPRWFELFKQNGQEGQEKKKDDDAPEAISGATPKEDYFSVRAEVKPGSKWICWIEMNLAGDYNESYPQQNVESKKEDEFSNGQPALLYRADLIATEGSTFGFELAGQSMWEDGVTSVAPVSEGVTTAREVFDKMNIEVIRPKPKLIGKNKTKEQ